MEESANHTEPVHYRTAAIDGIDVFYREAGPDSAPVVLLPLHAEEPRRTRDRPRQPADQRCVTARLMAQPGRHASGGGLEETRFRSADVVGAAPVPLRGTGPRNHVRDAIRIGNPVLDVGLHAGRQRTDSGLDLRPFS